MFLRHFEGVEDVGEIFLYSRVGEHPVCFVQDQELKIRQVLFQMELVVLDLVHEPAWRRHYNVWNVGKLRRLLHHIDASRDDACP